ncbi:hypothetical protein J3E72DRAFT_389770 [Bipolaris maydis]|uniref:uncharacterized protein n=1 Tax=Cochliobolus heterostrophus TaxID=5016 RepID=UPI0024D6E826|nr:hypothetical protein J3E74DRAFT_422851 [Bipolaris maydis]KAJ6192272.1 hypothetical protein J3E72DRAFT_389770 [Bipolaris maydis]KAJ6267420.1 hypothetical protein PSV08DRAFT_411801 [Bipolaris maydis]KAJ6267628.1 hypothetical protein PSV08DRAFT_365123 [Bipolaris maydis]
MDKINTMSKSESTEKTEPHLNLLTKKIAIDCEMMRSNIDTDERFSGIRWADINPQNGVSPFSEVQAKLGELLRDRVVIGHDIEKDLRVLTLDLAARVLQLQGVARSATCLKFDMSVRDTQKYSGYRKYANPGAHQGPNLKNLALRVLGRSIKQGPVSNIEDAVATMETYRKAEVEIDWEQEQ